VTEALANLHRIAKAASVDELWGLLLAVLAGYGFDRVTYGYTRYLRDGSIGAPQDALFLSNHDRAALDGTPDMAFFMRTPMFRWVLTNTGACSWQWAEDARAAGRLTADEEAAMAVARRQGIVAGYSIAFDEVAPRARGAIGLTARPGLSQADVDALWAVSGDEIQVLCDMFHLRITHMPLRTQRRPLSPRQREALEWVADGKTSLDVAQIMGISAAMVEKHLRLARETLEVETTAHAIAKAMLLNQIFLAPCPAPVAAPGNAQAGEAPQPAGG
jgi:LuxR family transcriptional regulator